MAEKLEKPISAPKKKGGRCDQICAYVAGGRDGKRCKNRCAQEPGHVLSCKCKSHEMQ
jgi:hypothetical protein